MPKRTSKTTYRQRVQIILDEEGISGAELARKVGVTRATVSEWLSGRSGLPRADVPFHIQDKYGYAARWIALGDGPMKLPKFDPSDSVIIENLPRIVNPEHKQEVVRFVDYQINR
jgi:transcriptional regulator with XRE-family HTH domain